MRVSRCNFATEVEAAERRGRAGVTLYGRLTAAPWLPGVYTAKRDHNLRRGRTARALLQCKRPPYSRLLISVAASLRATSSETSRGSCTALRKRAAGAIGRARGVRCRYCRQQRRARARSSWLDALPCSSVLLVPYVRACILTGINKTSNTNVKMRYNRICSLIHTNL